MIKGIDFSFGGGVTAGQIKTGGFEFVCRYLTGLDGNPKDITAGELGAYLTAGLGVVFVFERSGQEFTEAAGTADAHAAQAQLDQLAGALKRSDLQHAPVFFAQDIPEAGGVDPVAYMRGVNSVIGLRRSGIYSTFATVKALFDAKVVAYGWQTSGGSGGVWDNRAIIRQDEYDVKVGAAMADVNQAAFWGAPKVLTAADDFGQFPTPAPKPKPVPTPKPHATRHVADGKLSLHQAARAHGVSVEGVVLCTLKHGDRSHCAALLAYLAIGNWSSLAPVRRSRAGANGVMPKGRVVYWLPAR